MERVKKSFLKSDKVCQPFRLTTATFYFASAPFFFRVFKYFGWEAVLPLYHFFRYFFPKDDTDSTRQSSSLRTPMSLNPHVQLMKAKAVKEMADQQYNFGSLEGDDSSKKRSRAQDEPDSELSPLRQALRTEPSKDPRKRGASATSLDRPNVYTGPLFRAAQPLYGITHSESKMDSGPAMPNGFSYSPAPRSAFRILTNPRSDASSSRPHAASDTPDSPSTLRQTTLPQIVASASQYQHPTTRSESPSGFVNLGNTCYAGAVLTLLLRQPLFEGHLLSACRNDSMRVHSALVSLVSQLHRGEQEKKPVNPSVLQSAFRKFFDFEQHDAHEFLLKLFDELDREARSCIPVAPTESGAAVTPWLSQLTCGEVENIVSCGSCGHSLKTCEPFCVLSVQVLQQYCTVQKMIDRSFEKTPLTDYKCDACKSTADQWQVAHLKMLPDLLFVHFKRFLTFKTITNRICIEKDTTVVQLSSTLRLQSADSPCGNEYRLVGVLRHLGSSPSVGHYVTDFLEQKSNKWLCANDTSITPSEASQFTRSRDSYICLFERVAQPAGELQAAQPVPIGEQSSTEELHAEQLPSQLAIPDNPKDGGVVL